MSSATSSSLFTTIIVPCSLMLRFCFFVAIASATFAVSAPSNSSVSVASLCGSHPTAEWRAEAEAHFSANKVQSNQTTERQANALIKTYFHVISNSQGDGNIPNDLLKKQLNVLNNIYNNLWLSFQVTQVTRNVNDDWYSTLDAELVTQEEVDSRHEVSPCRRCQRS
ncbi:hypothetical protein HGRIS_004683 [Hohenbuehelia grisea]|uniref:Uncharacterized protein n=1 Tax=Hohenbuehelia grisea TaxID=104357 RepID=A0ABR3JCL8_9AGAR